MADTLLHITLARHILSNNGLNPTAVRLAQKYADDYIAGSVLLDLPYYDTLLLSGIQTLCHLPTAYNRFGQCLHEHCCRDVCVAFVREAHDEPTLALALGVLTHFAVDLAFHGEIEARIANTGVSHDTLERQIGLLCHNHLLGHSGVGTAYAQRATFIWPEANWPEFAIKVLREFHCGTPNKACFLKWQRSFRVFGALYSKPWFPWLNTTCQADIQLKRLSTSLIYASATNAVTYLNSAMAFRADHINLQQFTATLPLLRMSDGRCETD